MVLIGIDYGDKRIGLAKSDELGVIAQPLGTIKCNRNLNIPITSINNLIKEHKVEKIVLGLPLNMDDSEGEKALQVRAFAKRLEKNTKLPVILFDERLSTVQAHEIIHMQGKKTGKNKERIDTVAACVILQDYLDEYNSKK